MRGLCRWFRACFWCFSARFVYPCAFCLALWANVLFLSFPYGKVTNLLAMLVWTCALRYFAMAGVATHPEGICDEFARNCDEFARNLFLFIPWQNFFWKFSPKSLHVSILLSTFALATILVWSIPHELRARIYVQARPKYLLRLWAYFFAQNLAALSWGCALSPCGAFHILCGYAKTEYGGSPSTCFLALSGGSHECCSRRGRTSRFFRTPTSTRTRRIRA